MSTDSAPPLPGNEAAARSAYVVDGDPEIGTLLVTVLGAFGFAARNFAAPDPFFREIDRAFPGLVVLDLALGQSAATEIIDRLAALRYRSRVLLISSGDEAGLARIAGLGERHGMIMLQPLRKPFRASEIKARVIDRWSAK
jgi:DNA-binding response OmpR family regulator